jgi:HAD superfamily hydrolase (TIGR01490 family)
MGTISSKNKLNGKSYIVFFDLDHTLIMANSGKLLIKEAREQGMMSLIDLATALWMSFLYKFHLRNTEKIIAGMVQWLEGIPLKEINRLSSEVFLKHMICAIPDEARSVIRMHKEKSAAVVILSSALFPVCQAVAGYLNIDDIICTHVETIDGISTGRPSGRLCFGKEKVARLKEYCEKNNSRVENAWYYGDSFSDFPVLQITGNPVCVNPDRKLLKAAKKYKWKVCRWNTFKTNN